MISSLVTQTDQVSVLVKVKRPFSEGPKLFSFKVYTDMLFFSQMQFDLFRVCCSYGYPHDTCIIYICWVKEVFISMEESQLLRQHDESIKAC